MNTGSPLTPEELKDLGIVSESNLSATIPTDSPSTHLPKEEHQSDHAPANSIKTNPENDAQSGTYQGDAKIEDGESVNFSEEEKATIGAYVLEIKDPPQIVEIFDEAINTGQVGLHPWQYEVGEQLASIKPTSLVPHKFCLCACNGSGKDAYVIAPFVIWFALTKKKSLTIITSSSGVQLSAQTENYIRRLAAKINSYFGCEVFKINQRFIFCNWSKSEIRLFATDEAGKAEGYHPLEPGAEMAIIVNEAKSVSPEIFGALRRCTGYNYWLNVSTPGEPHGDFYRSFTRWNNKRHVSTFDCPHLSPSEREEDKIELGEHSALYRSKHLALFTSLGGTIVIPMEVVESLQGKKDVNWNHRSWPLRIGGDLAAGGDECVLTGTKGNRITERIAFRQKDTILSADLIEFHLLNTFKVAKEHEHIYMDDGGVGKAIIDNLRSRGWQIRRILNQSPAVKKVEFGNKGAEMWFRVKRIIEEGLFDLSNEFGKDKKFTEQLTNRYYKQQSTQGRITLESKADARAHGRPSPDRADSFILSLTGLTIEDFLKADKAEYANPTDDPKKYPRPAKGETLRTPEEIQKWGDDWTFQNFEKKKVKQNKPLYGSISTLLHRNN